MPLQPFNGHEISEELSAGVDLAYYIAVKRHATDKTKVIPATAGSKAIAIVIASEESTMSDADGYRVKRNKWKVGEKPTLYDSGTVYVLLGGTVAEDDVAVPGANGTLVAETAPTFSTDPTKAELDVAFAAQKFRLGEFKRAGVAGDIVPMKLF